MPAIDEGSRKTVVLLVLLVLSSILVFFGKVNGEAWIEALWKLLAIFVGGNAVEWFGKARGGTGQGGGNGQA